MDGETLTRHVRGDLPVDAVVATVDPDAPGWRESFREWAARGAAAVGVAPERFRKPAPVSAQVRLIRKNMPWIRTVWLAVADGGHLASEDFSGCGDVRAVPHAAFVPEAELPVFNSYAIEWNLFRIPGLSDAFVYFNDDFYPTAPSTMSDFVDAEGRMLLTMRPRKWGEEKTAWDRLCRRAYDAAVARWGDIGWPSSPCHAPRLWLVDECRREYDAAKARHDPPAARFRDCARDEEAVVAFCYASAALHGWAPRPPEDYRYLALADIPARPDAAAREWAKRKFTCVNDRRSSLAAYQGSSARLRMALDILTR